MSSLHRTNLFHEAVVAKNAHLAKHPSYQNTYRRLYLTRRLAEFFLSAIIIYGAHHLIIINTFFAPLWPSMGVALAMLFLRGNSLLAGLFVGTLLSYYFNHFSLPVSVVIASLFIFVTFLIRYCSLKFIGPITPLFTLSVLWKFIALCAIFCGIQVYLMALIFTSQFNTHFSFIGISVAFLGELNGILSLTPLCFVFTPFVPGIYFAEKSKTWLWVSIGIVIAHGAFFLVDSGLPTLLIACTSIIVLALYAHFFGQIALCFTLFALSTIYLTGTLPFTHLFHRDSNHLDTLILIVLYTVAMLLSLSIGTKNQKQYLENNPLI